MENTPKANERLKVVFYALNGASQCRVTREKNAIYNNKKNWDFVARSARVRLIAFEVHLNARRSSSLMVLGLGLTWTMRSIVSA